jgi:hypothetical protein
MGSFPATLDDLRGARITDSTASVPLRATSVNASSRHGSLGACGHGSGGIVRALVVDVWLHEVLIHQGAPVAIRVC